MVLREDTINERASLVEENSYFFMESHSVVVGKPVPPGYRTVWALRHRLAVAKLHESIDATTIEDDFGAILLHAGPSPELEDFIEVHIYGSFTRRAVERIRIKKPSNKSDKVIVRALSHKLRKAGISVEFYDESHHIRTSRSGSD